MPLAPEDPILNSPFSPPSRHWALDENGAFTSIDKEGRRRSEYLVPIAQARRTRQQDLPFTEETTENALINEIRGHLERWRALPVGQPGVTHETARLLDHWRSGETKPPLFFCQIEAVETIIWLEEVAARQPQHRSVRDQLRAGNEADNPGLFRWKRNTDLDPQLVWRGKDEQDAEGLTVDSVPIYIQEKIRPEAIISDLKRRSEAVRREPRNSDNT